MKKFIVINIILNLIISINTLANNQIKLINAPIINSLSTIAQINKLNLNKNNIPNTKINLEVNNKNLKAILKLINKKYNLNLKVSGNYIINDINNGSDSINSINNKPNNNFVTKIYQLKYAKSNDLVKLFKLKLSNDLNHLSKNAVLQADERTNSILISDHPQKIKEFNKILTILDSRLPHFEIQAKIIIARSDVANSLGVRWGGGFKVGESLITSGRLTNLTDRNNLGINNSAILDFGLLGDGVGNINFSFLNTVGALDFELSTLSSIGKVQTLSEPKILASHGYLAEIVSGVEIPYQVVIDNNVSTEFHTAALRLSLVPKLIRGTNTISMEIEINNDSVGTSYNEIPSKEINKIKTNILIEHGKSISLGGIARVQISESKNKIPILANIPLLGWLFKSNSYRKETWELMVFITPKIID